MRGVRSRAGRELAATAGTLASVSSTLLANELQRQQHATEHLQRELAELRSLVGQMRGGIAQR